MKLQLITPEKILFEGDIASVQIPGTEGDFGVLPGHAPFVSGLRAGVVAIEAANGAVHTMLVVGGLAEVNPDHTLLLAEKAVSVASMSDAEIAQKLAELQA